MIDTAAKVTITSDTVAGRLPGDIPVVTYVVIKTAGRGLKMRGTIKGPLRIKQRSTFAQINVYEGLSKYSWTF